MKNLSLIVAIGKNREIGKNNKLLWHIKEDLNFFKEKTIGKTIIMGEKTFYSLPGVLPNRKHIILTKTADIFPSEVEVFRNLDDLLEYITITDEEFVIVGGAMIYELFMPYVDKMYITEIDEEFDADRFFPEFDYSKWNKKILSNHIDNDLNYKHIEYIRKGND